MVSYGTIVCRIEARLARSWSTSGSQNRRVFSCHGETQRLPVIRRPTYDDVQRLSEGKASSSSRGWGSRQVCHRLNAEERRGYGLAIRKGFLTLKGSGYRKERKGSPLANIYRQYCDAGGVPCVNVLLISSTGAVRGGRREDLVLVDMAPTRAWCRTPDDTVEIRQEIRKDIHDAMMACCQENGWSVMMDGEDTMEGGVIRLVEETELREIVPWTVLTPLGDSSPEDILEHVSTAPIWQIPPEVVAFACPERSQAKALAKAIASWRLKMNDDARAS